MKLRSDEVIARLIKAGSVKYTLDEIKAAIAAHDVALDELGDVVQKIQDILDAAPEISRDNCFNIYLPVKGGVSGKMPQKYATLVKAMNCGCPSDLQEGPSGNIYPVKTWKERTAKVIALTNRTRKTLEANI